MILFHCDIADGAHSAILTTKAPKQATEFISEGTIFHE